MVVIKHACAVIQHEAVDLTERDYELQWVAHRVLRHDEVGSDEGERAPRELRTTQR